MLLMERSSLSGVKGFIRMRGMLISYIVALLVVPVVSSSFCRNYFLGINVFSTRVLISFIGVLLSMKAPHQKL